MPSLAIRSYVYDPARTELTVTFTTGRAYVYALLPPAVFAEFDAARAKGAFLNARIKDRYPFRKAPAPATRTPGTLPSLRDALRGSADHENET